MSTPDTAFPSPMTTLAFFSDVAECRKCGSTDVASEHHVNTRSYDDPLGRKLRTDWGPEHICRRCRRCGHRWAEATQDTGSCYECSKPVLSTEGEKQGRAGWVHFHCLDLRDGPAGWIGPMIQVSVADSAPKPNRDREATLGRAEERHD